MIYAEKEYPYQNLSFGSIKGEDIMPVAASKKSVKDTGGGWLEIFYKPGALNVLPIIHYKN